MAIIMAEYTFSLMILILRFKYRIAMPDNRSPAIDVTVCSMDKINISAYALGLSDDSRFNATALLMYHCAFCTLIFSVSL